MVTRALLAAAAALALAACDQFTAIEGDPLAPLPRPIVLMHRGGGAYNAELRENTVPALRFGASLYDGAEMDLQLSRDGTVWLGHSNDVLDCSDPAGGVSGGVRVGCFQELGDADIDAVAYCDTATKAPCADQAASTCTQHYVRLSDVFDLFSTDPTLVEKVLALDVKDQLCGSTGLPESRTMADRLDGLVRAYHMEWRLLVESDQVTFMREFRDHATPTYLFVEGYGGVDPIIEDAAKEGANGVSYRYWNASFDPAFPAGLRNRGLRVMVWPVPDPVEKVEDIAAVWAMNPDVIETDRSDFFGFLLVPKL